MAANAPERFPVHVATIVCSRYPCPHVYTFVRVRIFYTVNGDPTDYRVSRWRNAAEAAMRAKYQNVEQIIFEARDPRTIEGELKIVEINVNVSRRGERDFIIEPGMRQIVADCWLAISGRVIDISDFIEI